MVLIKIRALNNRASYGRKDLDSFDWAVQSAVDGKSMTRNKVTECVVETFQTIPKLKKPKHLFTTQKSQIFLVLKGKSELDELETFFCNVFTMSQELLFAVLSQKQLLLTPAPEKPPQ